jgi:hypothetical protein
MLPLLSYENSSPFNHLAEYGEPRQLTMAARIISPVAEDAFGFSEIIRWIGKPYSQVVE